MVYIVIINIYFKDKTGDDFVHFFKGDFEDCQKKVHKFLDLVISIVVSGFLISYKINQMST